MAHRCMNGEMTPTSYTHGRCKVHAGKQHYASTCPFTNTFSKCSRYIENTNYEAERIAEREEAKRILENPILEIE